MAGTDEVLPHPGMCQADGQHLVVHRQHLGVLAEHHPGDLLALLHPLQDVRPEPPDVRQADLTRRARLRVARGRRVGGPSRGLGRRLGGCRGRSRGYVWAAAKVRGFLTAGRTTGGRRFRGIAGGARRLLRGACRCLRAVTARGRGRRTGRPGRGRRRTGRGGRRTAEGHPALDPVQPGVHALGGVVRAGEQHLGADQLELQPGSGRATHLEQAGRDRVGGPGQLGGAESGGLGLQPVALVLGDVDQPGRDRRRHRRHDHQIAQPAKQILGEPLRVLAGLDHLVDHTRTPRHCRAPRSRRRPRPARSRA